MSMFEIHARAEVRNYMMAQQKAGRKLSIVEVSKLKVLTPLAWKVLLRAKYRDRGLTLEA